MQNMNPARDPLLTEREKTHGDFKDNAETWHSLWKNFHMKVTEDRIPPTQQMALGMIFVKLARISSNPEVKDHWDDIAGYAKLASEACDK